MTVFLRSLQFMRPFKLLILLVIVLNVGFAALETAVVAIIYPLLQILFQKEQQPAPMAAIPPISDNSWTSTFSTLKDDFYAAIQNIISDPDPITQLWNLSLMIIGLFLVKNVVKYYASVYGRYLGESVIKNIRDTLFRKLMFLSQRYYSGNKTGYLLSYFANDIPTMNSAIMSSVSSLIRQPLQIIFPLYLVLSFSPYLTGISLLAGVLSVVFIQFSRKYLRRYSSRLQIALADVMALLQESLSGMRIIRSFSAEESTVERFTRQTEYYVRSDKKLQHVEQLVPAVNEMFAISALATVLFVGGSEVAQGGMSGEELMTFLFLLFNMMSPVTGMSGLIAQVQRGLVAGERVFEVLDTPSDVREGSKTIPEQWQTLAFENVSFAYTDKPAIQDISFTLQKGKTIALVGHSGSGKSTTADLLIRFYDPLSGTITLDRTSVQEFTQASYRGLFGVVSQEPILFNDTIRENIRFGRNISNEAIAEALRLAHAEEFVKNLPNGIDTHIGDRGLLLSGGQRQRIAIARALAANPDILIFDEATSALDSESEKMVQSAITNALQHRAAVIIAHRLSTILHADEIIVFDGGRIVERGKHEDLVTRSGGVYKKLYEIQFGEGEG